MIPPRLEKGEIENLFKVGKSVQGRFFRIVYRLDAKDAAFKVSCLSPKSIGSAVARNRARRLLREALIRSEVCLSQGIQMAIIGKAVLLSTQLDEIAKDLSRVVLSIGQSTGLQCRLSDSSGSTRKQ